jgi:hypothetical protein
MYWSIQHLRQGWLGCLGNSCFHVGRKSRSREGHHGILEGRAEACSAIGNSMFGKTSGKFDGERIRVRA